MKAPPLRTGMRRPRTREFGSGCRASRGRGASGTTVDLPSSMGSFFWAARALSIRARRVRANLDSNPACTGSWARLAFLDDASCIPASQGAGPSSNRGRRACCGTRALLTSTDEPKAEPRESSQAFLSGYAQLGLSTLFGLWFTPFLLRHVGRSDFGLWSAGMPMLTYVGMVDFGVLTIFQREVAFALGEAQGDPRQALGLPWLVGTMLRLVLLQMPALLAGIAIA